MFWTGHAVPFVGDNMQGVIAVMFLYAPALAARLSRRPFDHRAAGLTAHPIGLHLRLAGLALAVTWPLFFGAFLTFYGSTCGEPVSAIVGWWRELFAPLCGRWLGLGGAHWQLPPNVLLLALSQIVVIALPEEFFFRGYLLSRFEERLPSRLRLWGAPVGWPLLLSAALFAAGHVLVDFDPRRLSVFFPALVFGWMRARTGSVAAGALFHGLCNLFSEVLHVSFFR